MARSERCWSAWDIDFEDIDYAGEGDNEDDIGEDDEEDSEDEDGQRDDCIFSKSDYDIHLPFPKDTCKDSSSFESRWFLDLCCEPNEE